MRADFRSLALLALWLGSSAAADPAREFAPTYWTPGVHLTAGAGIASSVFVSDVEDERYGSGLNLKTEIGWYLNPHFAIEFSSTVNLTRVSSDLLLWDTQFGLGIRSRIGRFFVIAGGEPYVRAYVGWGPAVAVFSSPRGSADRIHLHGALGGLALGQVYATERGTVYFVEFGSSVHSFRSYDVVRDAGLLPETIARSAVTDGAQIYSIHLSVGLLAF